MKTLIIVDYQNDFAHTKGALYVPGGSEIKEKISTLLKSNAFHNVIATKDIHPQDHCSFKEQGGQWPSHCVVGSYGAEFAFAKELEQKIDYVLHKGRDKNVDSYSAFYDNDRKHYTGLGSLITFPPCEDERVYICGLALDYCVKYTAFDALDFVENVYIVSDAVKAVEQDQNNFETIYRELKVKGIKFVQTKEIV